MIRRTSDDAEGERDTAIDVGPVFLTETSMSTRNIQPPLAEGYTGGSVELEADENDGTCRAIQMASVTMGNKAY